MSLKRPRSPSPHPTQHIFKSAPILDRSSKFVALYSPTLSARELQSQLDIKSATHRIAAWRKPSSQRALSFQRLFDTGHDDDGEKYGGKTLGSVLTSMEVEGAIVVARWYGGVMLGPARFDHIRNSAREAISAWLQESEMANKRFKMQEEIERKDQLARVLQERDQSITVLRGLLAEKNNLNPSNPSASNISAKVPQYSNLPLPTLEKLEQVKDATIGWILKQIDKAESAQQDDTDEGAAVVSTGPVLAEASKGDVIPTTEVIESLALKSDAGLLDVP